MRLNGNQFFDFNSFPTLAVLTELYINHNCISKVAPVVTKFPQLEILDISHNQLDDINDVKELSKLPQLVELFIDENPVIKLPRYAYVVLLVELVELS